MNRQMLSVDFPGGRHFHMRAAAIIRREGHLLIHRAVHEPFWTLPGGRVEFGEAVAETLAREMVEELECSCVVGLLRFLAETFFSYDGMEVHEVGYYHEVELTGAFPFVVGDICHRIVDGGAELEFLWVPLTSATLREQGFVPAALIEPLASARVGFEQIVERQP